MADERNDPIRNGEGGESREVAVVESPAHLDEEERGGFKERWDRIQASFIDEPRESVEAANELVKDLSETITDRFRRERVRLEERWEEGDGVSTEDLRVTLQRYRSFFDRLLSV